LYMLRALSYEGKPDLVNTVLFIKLDILMNK